MKLSLRSRDRGWISSLIMSPTLLSRGSSTHRQQRGLTARLLDTTCASSWQKTWSTTQMRSSACTPLNSSTRTRMATSLFKSKYITTTMTESIAIYRWLCLVMMWKEGLVPLRDPTTVWRKSCLIISSMNCLDWLRSKFSHPSYT